MVRVIICTSISILYIQIRSLCRYRENVSPMLLHENDRIYQCIL